MIAAAGADELEHVGAAAAETAVHGADRLAPRDRRTAGAGLPGHRERHDGAGPAAQPRVTAIMRARYGDGGQMDSRPGTGHGAGVARTAHFNNSPQAVVAAAAGSGAAMLLSRDDNTHALRSEYPSQAG
jgi:hypothetical protein